MNVRFLSDIFGSPLKSSTGSRRRKSRNRLERLEERVVLTAGMTRVADQILIQYEPSVNVQYRAMNRFNADSALIEEIESAARLNMGDGVMELVKVPIGMTSDDAVAWYSRQPGVVYAEPNYWIAPMAVSNDPYYTTNSRLWGMYGSDSPTAVGPTGTTNAFGIHAENAWNDGFTGSSSIYVGIIDTGVQVTHPDLAQNMWVNPYDPPDGIDNDGNGYVDDVYGWDFHYNDNTVYDGTADAHGTHVAGTIGGVGGNGVGVAGVNWNITMITAKFLGPNGGYTSDAVKAVDYLTDLKLRHGINIVATNNSWGGGGYLTSLHNAILRSAKADILFVAAAGNSSANNDATPSYPSGYTTLNGTSTVSAASYESVIAVANITSTGALSSTSSYGANTVDIGAPGSGIWSTVPTNSYSSYSGTSMATPHVTGAIALMAARYPSATAAQLRNAIIQTATPTASLAGKTVTGGRLNVFAAINHSSLVTTPPVEPSVTVADASKAEGNTGSSNLVFTVTLSNAYNQAVSLTYTTADGTATAGTDYVATSGTLTIPSGATTGQIAVAILGDFTIEANETFQLIITSATNATIADGTAIGTILNDDAVPSLSIANVSMVEGNSGTSNMVFTVNMSNATDSPVTVNFATVDGTALAGVDYLATAGTLTIPAFATSATIAVPIIGDTEIEADETFGLNLTGVSSNATISAPFAVGTIINDDFATPTLNVNDVSVLEGRNGKKDMNFVLTLSAPATSNVSVSFATANGTATAGSDYTATSGTLTILAGQSSGIVTVKIHGDRTVEPDETLFLNLFNPSSNVILSRTQAVGTILDDDGGGNSSRPGNGNNRENASAFVGVIAAPLPEWDEAMATLNDLTRKPSARRF